MTTLIKISAIKDVREAFDYKSDLTGDWIYDVDPETMEQVKDYYNTLPGDYSLYNAFCNILRYSKNNNITF